MDCNDTGRAQRATPPARSAWGTIAAVAACAALLMGNEARAQTADAEADTVAGSLPVATALPTLASAAAQRVASGQIRVSGQALVGRRPDAIQIALGVETVHDSIEQSKRQNAAIVVAALAAVQQAGVGEEAVVLDQVDVAPRYRDSASRQGLVQYVTRNAFTVTVDHPGKVEPVVAAALQAGVNYLHGIAYGSTELDRLRSEAQTQALRNARDKAEQMAAALDRQIGQPLQIVEADLHTGYRAGEHYWRPVAPAEPWLQALPGHLGDLEVAARVEVVFELVP